MGVTRFSRAGFDALSARRLLSAWIGPASASPSGGYFPGYRHFRPISFSRTVPRAFDRLVGGRKL